MTLKLTLRQIRITIFILTFGLLTGGAGYWLGQHNFRLEVNKRPKVVVERITPADKQDIDFSLFWDVWDRLTASYLDKEELIPYKMVYGAIKGMVASAQDPYTVFLEPEENQQTKEDLNGAFGGVGIQLGYRDGQLAVIAPLAGMPAEEAGIQATDLILKVDDQETMGMTLPEAVRLIRGTEGTKVKLTLLREGEEDFYEAVITRQTILIPSVEVDFVAAKGKAISEASVAHLKLRRFGDRTNEEWQQAVEEIASRSTVSGVILDVRNNPGGYLSGAVFIASEFLPSGVVVHQENASGVKESYSVNREGRVLDWPLVVLVNKGSASASEIVAGALQELKRAKVVGETTFGKGTIQEAQELPEGAGLHITTARWLLPSGKTIDQAGVTPDEEMVDDSETTEIDEQLEKAIEILLKS